jgi:hypothetical protein
MSGGRSDEMSESNEQGIAAVAAAIERQRRQDEDDERRRDFIRASRAARERSAAVARATVNASREMYERVYGRPGDRRRRAGAR